MRVFLDTNVLVSAFATRGLCADVLRHVLADHELVLGEPVVAELRRVLREKIRLPRAHLDRIEEFLRENEIAPRPKKAAAIPIRDASDRWILATAIAAKVDVLVTGDRDLLDIVRTCPVKLCTPREFWDLLQAKPRER